MTETYFCNDCDDEVDAAETTLYPSADGSPWPELVHEIYLDGGTVRAHVLEAAA